MWQTKIIASPLQQCQEPKNVAEWWLSLRCSQPQSQMNFDHVVSGNHVKKLNSLYLYYHIAYGQDGDAP